MKRQTPIWQCRTQLILALDADTFDKAKYFVDLLYPKIKIFKVGIQLFTGCGPKIVEFIHKKKAEVFLDLKFFDIPNTVSNALRQAARMKVKMLTLHILGDAPMLIAAKKAADEEAKRIKVKRPLLVGVTVLTSKDTSSSDVLTLARIGIESGLDGVVCSAREVSLLKKEIKKKFFCITPGIRLKAEDDDQKRTATVREAIIAGSDFLVVGRPILEADEPQAITEKILGEISNVDIRCRHRMSDTVV